MTPPLDDRALDHLRDVAEWPVLPGTRYEIRERLGEGGMSVIFRAYDRQLERDVALKLLRASEEDSALQQRLEREARILATLEHPSIVPVHDVGRCDDGRVFYVMKLVQGDRLDRAVEKMASVNGKLRLFEQACQAVAFAHSRGVIHRDLKPGNIMVGPFGEVLVLDWGVAKRRAEEDAAGPAESNGGQGQTEAGTILGTPGYMSPEQGEGRLGEVDSRSDIFSLGALLLEILGGDPGLRRPRAIAEKAMAPDPDLRYQSAGELLDDLRRHLDGGNPLAYREHWLERLGRFAVRNRTLLLLFGAYLLTRVLIGWLSR